jgi:hypothetical protein
MEDTVSSVFLAGRERHARLRQFAAFVVGGTLLVHLTLFLGYTRTVADADAANRNLVALKATAEATTEVHVRLDEFKATLDPKPVLDALLSGLKDDFRDLSEGVSAIRSDRPAAPDPRRMAIQQAPPKPSAVQERLGDKAVADRIRLFKGAEEMRSVLDGIIAETIVKKRFAEANEEWRTHLAQAVVPAATRAHAAILHAGADPRMRQLDAALTRARTAAERFALKPPANGQWWTTPAGKEDAIETLAHRAADSMVDAARAESISSDVADDAQSASDSAAKALAELDAHRKEIESQSKAAIDSLASFAKPLEFVAVDAATLVRWFPLVVGMALAVAVFLGTEARRGFSEAIDFAAAAAPDAAAWKRVVEQSRATLRRGASPWTPWIAAAVLWCGAAAWRLASLQMASAARATSVAAAGVALVALAVAHRTFAERAAR